MKINPRYRVLLVGVLTLAAGPVGSVLGGDGRFDINDACAAGPGCFPGDAGGYPVEITAPGSYRLVGNLSVPENARGIWIQSNSVTLDLNGFSVSGKGGGGPVVKHGILVDSLSEPYDAIEIRGGTVHGFHGYGVFVDDRGNPIRNVRVLDVQSWDNVIAGITIEAEAAVVRGCTSIGNGGSGIEVTGAGSLVIDCLARGNVGTGLVLTGELMGLVGYRSNVLTGNATALSTSFARDLGQNICDGGLCP